MLTGDVQFVHTPRRLDKQRRFGDFELGGLHLQLERRAVRAEGFEKGKHLFFHRFQGFRGGKLRPMTPAQRGVGLVELVDVLGIERQTAPSRVGFARGFGIVETLEKEQIRDVFDGIERVVETVGPNVVPQAVDLRFQRRVGEHEVIKPPVVRSFRAVFRHRRA